MKIAVVLPFFHVGGVERWAMHVRNALVQAGHEVTLSSLGPITADAAMFAGGPPPRRLGLVGLITLLLSSGRPDLLISALTKPNVMLSLAGRLVGIPVVGSVHLTLGRQPFESAFKYHLRLLLHRFICANCRAVIAVSEGVRNELVAISPGHAGTIVRIYNPCFTENEIHTCTEERKSSSDSVALAAAGRLHVQKGFDLLIDAFAQMPTEQRNTATLTIFGTGPDESALRNQIEAKRLSGRIQLAGNVDALPIRLRAFDVFVLSSRYEGFGNVLAEAMAAGCRCLAFDVPHGPREILRDGEFGSLVPAGDCTAMAHAMADVVTDVRLGRPREHDDATRRAHLRSFTPEAFSEAFRSLIDKATR